MVYGEPPWLPAETMQAGKDFVALRRLSQPGEGAGEEFEAADLIVKGLAGAITARTVIYDFARLMDGAQELSCSAFGDAMISHM